MSACRSRISRHRTADCGRAGEGLLNFIFYPSYSPSQLISHRTIDVWRLTQGLFLAHTGFRLMSRPMCRCPQQVMLQDMSQVQVGIRNIRYINLFNNASSLYQHISMDPSSLIRSRYCKDRRETSTQSRSIFWMPIFLKRGTQLVSRSDG